MISAITIFNTAITKMISAIVAIDAGIAAFGLVIAETLFDIAAIVSMIVSIIAAFAAESY